MNALELIRSYLPLLVPLLLLLFTGVCVLGAWRLTFDGDFARLNGVTAETRRDEEIVREVWGKALSLTTVVVSGANPEEALQKNERLCAALRALQQQQVPLTEQVQQMRGERDEVTNRLAALRDHHGPAGAAE